jgi:CDP-diacylglycerol--glycerol-3-phosphate 3-phosphatidyltransferase
VIAASLFGKLKTALQVAMVMVLITAGGHPLAARLLVYVTVFVTVLSGVDYFFGLRRHLRIASAPGPGAGATD